MAGYYKYSMSNNAVKAYKQGEKPLSKWTKTEILSNIEFDDEVAKETADKAIAALTRLNLAELREFVLEKSSWHHTSMFYNVTNFYEVDKCFDEETAQNMEQLVAEIIQDRPPRTRKVKQEKLLGKITVAVYGDYNPRKQRATYLGEDTKEGEVKNGWLCYDGGRYKIAANKTQSIEYKIKDYWLNLEEQTLDNQKFRFALGQEIYYCGYVLDCKNRKFKKRGDKQYREQARILFDWDNILEKVDSALGR